MSVFLTAPATAQRPAVMNQRRQLQPRRDQQSPPGTPWGRRWELLVLMVLPVLQGAVQLPALPEQASLVLLPRAAGGAPALALGHPDPSALLRTAAAALPQSGTKTIREISPFLEALA